MLQVVKETRRRIFGADSRLKFLIALAIFCPVLLSPVTGAAQTDGAPQAGAPQAGATQAGATQAGAPAFEFAVRRVEQGVVVLLRLPAGRLTRDADGYAPIKEEERRWHVLLPPFDPYLSPPSEDQKKVYEAVFSAFHDQKPPDFRLSPLPRHEDAATVANGLELEAEAFTAPCPTAGGVAEQTGLRLFCLLRNLQEAPGILLPIDTPSGPAALIFEARSFENRVTAFASCVKAQPPPKDEEAKQGHMGCAPIPALLVHDRKTLNSLALRPPAASSGQDLGVLNLEGVLSESGLFEVVDFLHPTQLLAAAMASSSGATPSDQDAVLYRVRSLAEEGAAPSPHLARKALLFYRKAYGRGAAPAGAESGPLFDLLLKTPLPDAQAAADLAGGGVLSEAFLPAADRSVEILAAPGWLYDRLASTAFAAQAEKGRFCRAEGAGGRMIFGASEFSAFLGDSTPFFVDETRAPNVKRRELYAQSCGVPATPGAVRTIFLTNRFASRNYGEVCGLPRAGLGAVDHILGEYRLSPVVDAPWRDPEREPWRSASFVLSDVEEGVYLQSRPVSLGDFAEYLTSPTGCDDFVRSPGFAQNLVRCDGGRLTLFPDPSQTPPDSARFRYFYGAISDVWREETQTEPAGLTCLDRASKEDRGLCATQFFLAARAVDRLFGEPADPPPKETAAAEGAARQEVDLWAQIRSAQGEIKAEDAGRLIDFTACDGPEAQMLTAAAQPLCFALQRYVRAAFFPPPKTAPTSEEEASDARLWREAPITMVSHRDVDLYLKWRGGSGFSEDPAQVKPANLCKSQLRLPTAAHLVRGAASDAAIKKDLLPDLERVMLEGDQSAQSVYRAAVFASSRHIAMGKAPAEVGVAGLPVGFRQITADPPPPAPSGSTPPPPAPPKADPPRGVVAQIPDFKAGRTLGDGFGLSPRATSRYFKELADHGGCLECVSSRNAFWWSIWLSDADDPSRPLHAGGGEPAGGDPATGFRLMLKLNHPDARK